MCSNAVNNHFLRDVRLARVYLLRALSLQPTAAPEITREILDENLLTVDELKPLEGFAFQFLVCHPLRLQRRTRDRPSGWLGSLVRSDRNDGGGSRPSWYHTQWSFDAFTASGLMTCSAASSNALVHRLTCACSLSLD